MPSRHHLYYMYSASESEEEEEEEEEIDEVLEYKKSCDLLMDLTYFSTEMKERFGLTTARLPDEDVWNHPEEYYSVRELFAPIVSTATLDLIEEGSVQGNGVHIDKYTLDTIFYWARGWCEINDTTDIFWVAKCIIDFIGI
jgi:hypothetical protein